ncbi:hypothetical protein Esi_0081_0070 [Ectocarpus siliculosus]|uniref:Uncharacterized protein n=1 Tax=Ectocarpus siliculosus TaxID=2880 RepID=D8LTA2_ECTSI|nr:hypothetical protein Esi_0081_0070 [Ectocarpus siliculosus]|eukprot:CBN77973.1 hypothetical protein Esi_0081_0070 [Ectocarpus siliculosus]
MMLARSISRVAAGSARRVHDGQRACISSLVGGCNSPSSMPAVDESAAARPKVSRPAAWGVASLPEPSKVGSCRRHLSSGRPPFDMGEDENEVDVTPIGNKPGQITREAIAEAEASEDLDDDDIFSGKPSDWEYDASTEEAGHDSEKAEAGREGFRDEGDEGDENPPTPILDAYEKSRDPAEMERLIALAFDSLPERAGPQRYNHKRREHQRYRTIRNIKYKEKAQRTAAHERKLQKRRDRKARDLALFATWRETGPAEETADAVVRS